MVTKTKKLQEDWEEEFLRVVIIGSSRRSPLYDELANKFDKLASRFTGNRVNWDAAAHFFAEHGIKDGKGNLPSAKMVQSTWARVKKDRGGKRTPRDGTRKKPPAPPQEESQETDFAQPLSTPNPSESAQVDHGFWRIKFRSRPPDEVRALLKQIGSWEPPAWYVKVPLMNDDIRQKADEHGADLSMVAEIPLPARKRPRAQI